MSWGRVSRWGRCPGNDPRWGVFEPPPWISGWFFYWFGVRPHVDRTAIQYNSHLDIEEHVSIRPDLVSFRGNRPHLVADPKYKAERPSGFPNADIYQMLAYCTALDLPIGHLIYAEGNEDARHHTVRHAGIRVVAHTLDLNLSPQELLDEVDALARVIVSLAGERTPSGIGV